MNIFLLGMAGLLYGIFVSYTGLAIPCLFRKVTGLLCPGCGVTGMCVALLHLNWKGAFFCHPVLFVLLLPLTAVFICSAAGMCRMADSGSPAGRISFFTSASPRL